MIERTVDKQPRRIASRGSLPGGQKSRPPTGAKAEVANGEKGTDSNHEKKQNRPRPAQASLGGIMAQDACLAYIGGKRCPSAVVIGRLPGFAIGFEKAIRPVLLIQAKRACIASNNSLVENAAWKSAKLLLLQREQVALANLGNRRDFFKRNAAG